MKKSSLTISYIISLLMVGGLVALIYLPTFLKPSSTTTKNAVSREIVQVSTDTDETLNVSAAKLPEFVFNLASEKFKSLQGVSPKDIAKHVDATIAYKAYASTKIDTEVSMNEAKHQLIVNSKDVANFKPGLYKLSLTLRTNEGVINIDQDFAWGVIAVNTTKSIYKPGDEAKIGIGVLNDRGETQCATGIGHVDDLSMKITDPKGTVTNLSMKNNTIKDSGKCGPTTVTNEADFQATYPTTTTGIYQMKVVAVVRGEKREIEDYFKVEENTPFDVERTSFPTRIYPHPPYPVTFTVTPNQDYQGTVEETVPTFFGIEHISNGGTLKKDGDFTHIVWKTKLTKGKAQTFTYFIKFPPVSPEFYLLGPIKIGNFEEARQWQIASDALNSTSGLISYEDNSTSNTWSRIWTGTDWSPAIGTNATSMSTTPADSRWFREVSSPKTGEKLVAVFDNNNDGNRVIYMFRWTGTTWAADFNIDPATNFADANSQRMDVAYEELSGDALFVYADSTGNDLKYRKRVSGTWDGADSVAGTSLDSIKLWVRLKPQFESDTIMLAYENTNERIGAQIWDGSVNTFGDQFNDDVGSAAPTDANSPYESFDIAWETSSGAGYVFWGTTANNIVYRKYTGTWAAEATAASGFTNDIAWLVASSDPRTSSNNIAIATQEMTAPVCKFGMWNGSALTIDATTATCRSATVGRLINTAFENNTGKAMWIFNTSGNPTLMSWRTWLSGTFSGITAETGTTGNIESMQLYSDLNTTTMVALYVDAAGNLWDREWDGSTWSGKRTLSVHTIAGANQTIQGTGENAEAYGYGFDRNLETLVAYRWFANNATDLGASLTALTAQDTPYTLTTATQPFRLRLLLYYPDALASNALRQYKLQYVDPGTGTCASPTGGTPSTYTDVPTSGGTTISFNNNAALASGDNIATSAADPVFQSLTRQYQDYQESNTFTNSRTNIVANQLGIWDFSLIDNTVYDRAPQAFCFRVARSNDLVLQIDKYPQINTAALSDVLIQGGSLIQSGSLLQ